MSSSSSSDAWRWEREWERAGTRGCRCRGREGEREGGLARWPSRGVESASTSSLGGRGTGEPCGACALVRVLPRRRATENGAGSARVGWEEEKRERNKKIRQDTRGTPSVKLCLYCTSRQCLNWYTRSEREMWELSLPEKRQVHTSLGGWWRD